MDPYRYNTTMLQDLLQREYFTNRDHQITNNHLASKLAASEQDRNCLQSRLAVEKERGEYLLRIIDVLFRRVECHL